MRIERVRNAVLEQPLFIGEGHVLAGLISPPVLIRTPAEVRTIIVALFLRTARAVLEFILDVDVYT